MTEGDTSKKAQGDELPREEPRQEDQQKSASPTTTADLHPGFSGDVHDYLRHHVSIADAKSGAVVAAVIAVSAVATRLPRDIWDCWSATAGGGSLLVALAVGVAAVFPRLPTDGTSRIFWMGITRHRDVSDYLADLSTMTAADAEHEFARQNYFVSRVLRKKYRLIQIQLGLFVLGVALIAASAAKHLP